MTETHTTRAPSGFRTVAALIDSVRAGSIGPAPDTISVSTAFLTAYGTRHTGRTNGYRNEILSLRIGSAVGSCGAEPGHHHELSEALDQCVGTTVSDLLDHPIPAVRIAALDGYLMHVHPHPRAAGCSGAAIVVDGPSSLAKSQVRARTVADLLPVAGVRTVLVIGVVNSLLAQLRARGISYIACDAVGGVTEWGEPVLTSTSLVTADYDALLVTGMTLVNGSFDDVLRDASQRDIPLVMFAQSGSAVLPWFLGDGAVTAISAEPYPFFSLDGGPSTHFHYRRSERR
ncbi:Rossmann-like domain-containing protein [Nocardia arizonensis]|uniref:Rossmann-like domain-containing protein n=1 Tax=Nocardia arizonensis TaxID=1141647 RepID=UPI0006CFB463|nr:DUF364 domain-containing protein [Nocardia arizonensis]